MLDPMESNFCGSEGEELSENPQLNEATITINPSNQPSPMEISEVLEQDDSNNQNLKKDASGKWIDPGKGKRPLSEPYPSVTQLRNSIIKEQDLPQKLLELLTPFQCNLCDCEMSSTSTAKDHYNGKKHIINIKRWFFEHPEYCDEMSKSDNPEQPIKVMDPSKLYCKYCDLMLSSEQQAESHYKGRKHKNVIHSGVPKNAYYNPATGKWERLSINNDGKPATAIIFLEKQTFGNEIPIIQKLFCNTCKVACPSEITFSEHLAGAKHKKKMAFLNSVKSVAKDEFFKELHGAPGTDLTVYRTPTGKYYCQLCNVCVNSPSQFMQHSESKKHMKKMINAGGNVQPNINI